MIRSGCLVIGLAALSLMALLLLSGGLGWQLAYLALPYAFRLGYTKLCRNSRGASLAGIGFGFGLACAAGSLFAVRFYRGDGKEYVLALVGWGLMVAACLMARGGLMQYATTLGPKDARSTIFLTNALLLSALFCTWWALWCYGLPLFGVNNSDAQAMMGGD